MNPCTEAVWDVVTEHDDLFVELTAIMGKEHKPFLNEAQTFQANSNMLKQHLRAKFTRWIEWLPTTPIDVFGASLAEEAFELIEWEHLARLVQGNILQANLAALVVPSPGSTA